MDISELEKKIRSGCISEESIIEYCDRNGLTTLQFSSICERLILNGISIVSSEEYAKHLSQNKVIEKNTCNINKISTTAYSTIIHDFSVLPLQDKYVCLSKLAYIIAQEEKRQTSMIKERFIETFRKKHLQYSYIAVLVKAFFEVANSYGIALLSEIIDYFERFYYNRKEKGLLAEKQDSVFAKDSFSKDDIRKIVLFNPMKRSFLSDYFSYSKNTDAIQIDSILWDTLTDEDIKLIISIADINLKKYYEILNKYSR